jgi:predicted dehydrogenase
MDDRMIRTPTPPRSFPTMHGVPFEARESVRVGFAGAGGRAQSLLQNLLGIEGVVVVAVQEIRDDALARAVARVEKAGQTAPEIYRGDGGFDALCARDDIDLVYVATPWDLHVPLAVRAMESGKHVAVEVPAATTLEGCWNLVETSERTRRHCVLLENCCYGWNEMLVLNLVRAGVFGELTHAEAAYIHDLRGELLSDRGEGLWRAEPHRTQDGNLYPTHGLGPVARYLDIPQTDRFEFLVSVSSRERGLTDYAQAKLADGDPRRNWTFRCGDMNTSILKTTRGVTVLLQHDVVSPRPYDRINMVSGTKGAFRDYPARVYIDGQEGHDWQPVDAFGAEYEHPLWKRIGELARTAGGHGGMDFLMNYDLIHALRTGAPPPIDVYDAAAWSAPGPLSELSVAAGSAPIAFPDFTRPA